jgi:nicotinate phosphoribosyltransferase
MAHSYVQAYGSEEHAFEAYAHTFPEHVTLLIDTYDVKAGATAVVRIAPRLRAEGVRIQAVRIDSGDLLEGARRARAVLDSGGCADIGIFASGNLDEYRVDALERAHAPIGGYGVGTRVNTSADRPYLDCAYKLVQYAGRPTLKLSPGKATWPGAKQVFRRMGPRGAIENDCIALDGEQDRGAPLLRPVMRGGRRVGPMPSLHESRALLTGQLDALPPALLSLRPGEPFPVMVSAALDELRRQVEASVQP